MDKVVPWDALLALIEPGYPTSGRRGRPPMPAATMLRIHFMQRWYALSDPAMEDALYEIESMRRFASLELNEDAIPDVYAWSARHQGIRQIGFRRAAVRNKRALRTQSSGCATRAADFGC